VVEVSQGVHFNEFNKRLRDKFKLHIDVKNLLYNHMDDKFIRNKLNVNYTAKIDEYDAFKKLVINSADPTTGQVDTDLFNSFV
jgi:hypothetical protein